MATPMILPGVCCLCWGPHGGGTFDRDGALVDVCHGCRIKATALWIRYHASYESED